MFKQIILGVIAIFVVALMPIEADAGCTRIGGRQVCASWITGSEICQVKTKKTDCSSGFCPELTCTVFGTVGSGCDTTLDPSCAITGVVFIGTNPDPVPHTVEHSLSESTVLFPDGDSNDDFRDLATVTAGGGVIKQKCNAKGNCTVLLDVEAGPGDVPPGTTTFTALVFNAQTKVCEGGIDGSGDCCDDGGQFFNGTTLECSNPPYGGITVVERCTVEEPIKAGKKKKYKCEPFPLS